MSIDLGKPVLIVDDNEAMRRIMATLMGQLGFTAIVDASDGKDALEKLGQQEVSMIISDWDMTPMTGIELLRAVRSDAKLYALPFIMVTAQSKTDYAVAAKEAGVSSYLVKPFTAQTLKAKLVGIFGKF